MNDKRFIVQSNKEFSWPNECWVTDDTSIPPSLVFARILNDHCYLRDCSRVNKKINTICQELERYTECPTDAHIFFAVEGNLNKGFGCHRDNSHNFIVQIEGTTHFRVWDDRRKEKESFTRPKKDPIIDTMMNPGDVIFIPMDYMHEAISQTPRLSISFPSYVSSKNNLFQDRSWIELVK